MKKRTLEEFISESNIIHHNKYDYSLVIYSGCKYKIKIKCYKHGIFLQTPDAHLSGKGCKLCGKIKSNRTRSLNKRFIEKALKIHKNKYNYNLTAYVNNKTKIIIICPKHGKFEQIPESHLKGRGCAKCSNCQKLTTKTFIKKSKLKHNNVYDYKLVNYKNNKSKVKIICKNHGVFIQKASHHLSGHGCHKCFNRVSKPETLWLNLLNIKEENRQISLPGLPNRIKIDGYDPDTNTVYEFLGSYYHGDPVKYSLNNYNKKLKKTFKELYLETINKEMQIRKAGYNYQFIWEHDFKS